METVIWVIAILAVIVVMIIYVITSVGKYSNSFIGKYFKNKKIPKTRSKEDKLRSINFYYRLLVLPVHISLHFRYPFQIYHLYAFQVIRTFFIPAWCAFQTFRYQFFTSVQTDLFHSSRIIQTRQLHISLEQWPGAFQSCLL